MSDFELSGSDESDLNESDVELQEAFAAGLIKPGLNTVHGKPKQFVNNVKALNQKRKDIILNLAWIEQLDCINAPAPLAPELAATMLSEEQKRENQLKNNKKLPQIDPSQDPVLNDFKREMLFHRQAQATVMHAIPLIKEMGIPTMRPDDYFAEMAKSDSHMQKIREALMNKQQQQQRSERVKELRQQRKHGKALAVQTKLQRHADKRQMLDQVKKVRKGMSNDLSFLDGKKSGAGSSGVRGGATKKPGSNMSRRALAKREMKDKKFGFGGKKRGTKGNTRDSAADIGEYKRPNAMSGHGGGAGKFGGNRRGGGGGRGGGVGGRGAAGGNKRPGKTRRAQKKGKGRK